MHVCVCVYFKVNKLNHGCKLAYSLSHSCTELIFFLKIQSNLWKIIKETYLKKGHSKGETIIAINIVEKVDNFDIQKALRNQFKNSLRFP